MKWQDTVLTPEEHSAVVAEVMRSGAGRTTSWEIGRALLQVQAQRSWAAAAGTAGSDGPAAPQERLGATTKEDRP